MWYHVILILIALLLLVAAYLFLSMPRMVGNPVSNLFTNRYYAHRGLFNNTAGVPENSLTAFENAIDKGYGIELDVQLTKDGIPVVFHDFSLKRVCGIDKKVSELTFEELSKITLLETTQTIPSFAEVLSLLAGRVPLIIELKTINLKYDVCRKVDQLLKNYQGDYGIQSFNPMALNWYKKKRPHIVRGQLSTNFHKEDLHANVCLIILQHMLLNFLSKPDYIAYNWKYRNILSRYLCHKVYKRPSIAWTVRSEEELDRCKKAFDSFIFEGFIPDLSN